MPTLRRIASLLLFSTALCAGARAAEPEWIEVRSPHFHVLTDGGEKRGREVAKRFEEMRGLFATFFFKEKTDIAVPIEIIAFRNTRELRNNSPLWKGKPIELAGYFQQGRDRDFVVLDLSGEDNWTTVFHEYAHVLINSNLDAMPLWFDEGLANFYMTLDVGPKQVKLGATPQGYGPLIGASQLWPVEKLFAVRHDSPEYNESGDRRSLFYAESWLVVHYMMERKMLAKMDAYEQAIAQHATIADAIQRAFGISSKQFDHELGQYVSSNRVSAWLLDTPPQLEAITYTSSTVSTSNARARLADLHFHVQELKPQALGEFQSVLADDPNNAVAHRGLGYIYLSSGDWRRAAAEFRRAAAADDKDPYVHYYAGMLTLQSGSRSREDVAAARAELERATSLNAGMPEAFEALGRVCALQEDWPAASNAMRRAWQLSPRDDRYVLQLANYLAFEKQFDQAETLLIRAKDSSDPAIAGNAEQSLQLVRRLKQFPADRIQVSGGRFQTTGDVHDDSSHTGPAPVEGSASQAKPQPRAGKVGWMSGTLVSVDCSKAPAAMLTVEGFRKTWKMYTDDYGKLPIVGSAGDSKFSCSWRNRRIAANYREGGSTGDALLVSLELQ